MADFQIIDKDELTNVDRSADYILVYDFNAAKLVRSNVNSLLDLLSHPVGINDVQTMTQKTLTAPNISSPILSGTITGTYTLGGTPTFPSSVVTLNGIQTLTNKVITSPTINTANIVNPTLTVNIISEHTAANGVTIDGLNIKDGALVTANSVPNAALAGAIVNTKLATGTDGVANAQLNTTAGDIGGAWLTFIPTINNLILGAGTKTGKYSLGGKTVTWEVEVICAADTVFAVGPVSIDPPITPNTRYTNSARFMPIGNSFWHDAGTGVFAGACFFDFASASGKIVPCIYGTAGTYASRTTTTTGVPFTLAATDTLSFCGQYEAA